MKIQKGSFSSQGLILIIFVGFLFSTFAISRSESETGGNKLPGKEFPERHASYEEYAELIAGIHTPRSTLASFEKSRTWTEFAKSLDQKWKRYDKKQLEPMREWAARELAAPISSGFTVFYPFSGPDFVNPYTLFPNAGTYILMALEPVGEIPDFPAMGEKDFDAFFADLQRSLHDLLSIDYFISAHMHAAMESKDLKGVLPILLSFMAREKAHILDVDYWFMEPDGTVRQVQEPGKGKPESAGSVPGVRVLFESAGSPGNKPQTLYYFRLNLYNGAFGRNSHFISFLKGFGPFITFMKSASYVMFDPDVSNARQFVFDQSRYILQEDSGIPLKYFDPSVWALQFYGTYREPISLFQHDYQADLAKIHENSRDIKPLPFGIGYHFQAGTANLLLATRK
jgi:hypothetical protein